MRQSNKLWMVSPPDSTASFSNLWILAASIENAIRKAKRWLKAYGYKTGINKVESHGTIDVF